MLLMNQSESCRCNVDAKFCQNVAMIPNCQSNAIEDLYSSPVTMKSQDSGRECPKRGDH